LSSADAVAACLRYSTVIVAEFRHPSFKSMSASQSPEQRLVELELLTTHLERDLATLNSVLLDQQKEIDLLKQVIGRLDERMARFGPAEDEPRDPGSERPPHY
jgi:uncharacterized coiled-coil protein SlyX